MTTTRIITDTISMQPPPEGSPQPPNKERASSLQQEWKMAASRSSEPTSSHSRSFYCFHSKALRFAFLLERTILHTVLHIKIVAQTELPPTSIAILLFSQSEKFHLAICFPGYRTEFPNSLTVRCDRMTGFRPVECESKWSVWLLGLSLQWKGLCHLLPLFSPSLSPEVDVVVAASPTHLTATP